MIVTRFRPARVRGAMQERRKQQRKNLMAYTQVFDLNGGHLLGYLGDLNLHGAMVIGEKAIVENTELTLAIELPELPNVKMQRITIPVRVAWCQQSPRSTSMSGLNSRK